MNFELLFRRAQVNDLPTLADFVNSAYRGESSKQGWTTEADLLGGQRTDPVSLQTMITDQQVILLAEDSATEKLLGCVYLKIKDSKRAYLGMLTVSPTSQAQGLGRKILQAAESFASKNWNTQSIEMTVISVRQELVAWYLRRGYLLTTKTESFPYGDPRFGLPKRSDLQFVVLEKTL